MDLLDKIEKISFLFPIIIAIFIVPIGFLIKHFFFSKRSKDNSVPFIKASNKILAGRDIIIGNKSITNNNKNTEAGIMPKVHISPFKKGNRSYAEIYNTGNEDISNLTVIIYWKQKGNLEKREMNRFFNENEDPIFISGHSCKYIRKGEKKIIGSLPMYSNDGKIKFVANGLGIKSNKEFSNNFFIDNIRDNKC